MRAGELLGGRFRIDALAEAGGMGAIYRARDLHTGATVAAKVLLDPSPQHRERFEREAEILYCLSHPGIVRSLAYESPPGERPYLIMEWLEGEDLGRLLARRRLSVAEAVELGARLASALGAAHAVGITHRDLKPGNVFLVDGRVNQAKLVDFGIAHFVGIPRITGAGALLGTPGYMAPEQARSSRVVGPAADVFALGCVLFECLTGAHPFQADQVSAMLARIIFDEAPRLGERCPEAPAWLERLVAQMLAKDPARRLQDGAAVAAALAAEEALEAPISAPPQSALTGSERRFLGLLVVGSPPAREVDATLSAADLAAASEELQEIAARFGQRLELLADGTAVLAVSHPAVPTDVAAQVARCALALQEHAPDRPMAITAGWGELGRRLPVGVAIGRASRLLGEGGRGAAPPILLDPAAAGLLDARFEIAERGGGHLELRGERPLGEASRPLLGRPTPCVGRDHELRLLEQTFASCAEEPGSMAVLVTGPAGVGKSRLLRELLERIRRAGTPAAIWVGRGDPLRAGSTGGLLAEALRGAAGIQGGEPLEARRELLRARVALHVPAPERRRVTEFLGELLGVPFPDEDSLPLRAARQDPDLLGEQMQRALRDFLRAECAAQPVVLALEDVQWADRVSLSLVDAALRELPSEPLLVLASARPEIDEVFPQLWAERGRQDLRLRQLSPRASERLARRALGDDADDALIQRLVAQSEGHPFFLEELIRAAAEGRGDALPETVVAMVQVRLDALPPRARRALRAASVLGEVFWRGAVAHLLGGEDGERLDEVLAALVNEELCVVHRESRIAGEREYAFRQALLREGAYALLTGEDRALGHRLAAEWLERAGEADPMVLAAHLERGSLPARAAALYIRGAERATARQAYLDAERCHARAEELLGKLPLAARRARGLTRFRLGRHESALADLAAAREEAAAEAEIGAEVELYLDEAMVLDWMGELRAAEERVAAAERRAAGVLSPLLGARLLLGVGRSLHRADREEEAAATLARAAEQAARLGDEGYETRLIALLLLGFILPGLGRVDEAARALDEVIRDCEDRGDLLHLGAALNNRAFVRAYRGDRAGMAEDFERTIAIGGVLGQATLELVGHFNFAEYLYLMDELDAAELRARDARAVAPRCGEHLPSVVPLLEARIRLYRGDQAGARTLVSEIRARPAEHGGALPPSEDVLCAMIELAAGDACAGDWDALEDRSARCSVGQEHIEVLEARGLAALRRGRRGEAMQALERALSVAGRIPNVMGERLRRRITALSQMPAEDIQ